MHQEESHHDRASIGHRREALLSFSSAIQDRAIGQTGLSRPPLHVLLTGVSSDSHTWNLVFMQLLLEHMGHRVTNLGACTPDEEVVQVCLLQRPDLLVVSTVNGHGNIDGERLIFRVRDEASLRDLPAVIGGKLGIRGSRNTAFAEGLLRAGFTAVFDADSSLAPFEEFVKRVSGEHRCAPVLEAVQ